MKIRKLEWLFILFASILLLAPDVSVAGEMNQEWSWAEIWGDTAYRKTNFSSDREPDKQEDFYIANFSTKAGGRFDIGERLFFDPYLAFDLNEDFGSRTYNKFYWNNHTKYGIGGRLKYEYAENENRNNRALFFNNINLAFFTEYLIMEDSWNGADDPVADGVPTENWRTGFSAWLSMDSRKFGSFYLWAEAWSEWAYSTTNFQSDNCDDFYIFVFQPKFGLEWRFGTFSVQPYLTADLTYDFGSEPWNEASWLNHIQYGPGFRFSFGNFKALEGASFNIYAEYLKVEYFSRVDASQYRNQADEDFRAGIELWLPFGRTKGSVIRH